MHTHMHTCMHTRIYTGNPVAIASTPVLSLVSGSQGSSFQALISFVSGSPQPLPENITWTFNGIPSTIIGSIFTLGNFINSGQAGTYVCTVQTMAGIVSTEFVVTVSGKCPCCYAYWLIHCVDSKRLSCHKHFPGCLIFCGFETMLFTKYPRAGLLSVANLRIK